MTDAFAVFFKYLDRLFLIELERNDVVRFKLKTKLIRYALSLGFEMDEVMDSVNEVMRNNNIEECDD